MSDRPEPHGHVSTTELLDTLLKVALVFFPLLALASLFVFEQQNRLLASTCGILSVLVLASMWLLKSGWVRSASALVLIAAWGAVTAVTIAAGGLQTGGVGYLLVVLVAGLLWGTRVGTLVGIVSVLAAFAISVAESRGLLPPRPEQIDSQRLWILAAIAIFWCVLLLHLGFRNLRRALDKAARNERKFADLVRDLPDAVLTLDDAGKILACNPAAERISGYVQDEIVGAHFADPKWMSAGHRQTARKEFAAALTGAPQSSFELALVGKDGREIPVEVNARVVLRRGRRQIRLVIRDTTERRSAATRLEAVERSYREVFEQAPVMFVITKDAKGSPVIEDCNERFAYELGYKREDLLGSDLADLYTSGSRSELLEKGGYQRAMLGDFTAEERRLVTRDGKILDTLLRSTPVKNLQGQVTGTRAAYVDISAQKRVQKSLELSEDRYRTLFEDSKDVVFITTPDGVLLDINPAGVELFEFESKDEMLAAGAPLSVYQNLEDRERLNHTLSTEGFVKDYELSLVTKQGRRLIVLETATAVRDIEGRTIATQGILRDVTRRRSLERQLRQAQRLEAIGRLAGGVAHDFNNLLTLIIGYTELLLMNTEDSDSRKDPLLQIQSAGDRASKLTSQLLAFTRQQVLEPRILDLNSVVRAIEELLRRTLGATVTLDVRLQPELSPTKLDAGQIDQILMNLSVNARDAMPEGGRILIETADIDLDQEFVSHHVGATQGAYVVLSFEDEGCGMNEETRNRVFEPFFTTKDPGQGTGLGLSTVYGIVKQSGGYISVSSAPGQGSTFRIYFPRSQKNVEVTASVEPSPNLLRGDETVLLVEDDDGVRRLVTRTLRDLGYTVIPTRDAEEGLRTFETRSREIDLLLTDIVLPGANGLELAKWVRNLPGKTAILAMSGFSGRDVLDESDLIPSLPFLHKPFSTEDLARQIREILDAG